MFPLTCKCQNKCTNNEKCPAIPLNKSYCSFPTCSCPPCGSTYLITATDTVSTPILIPGGTPAPPFPGRVIVSPSVISNLPSNSPVYLQPSSELLGDVSRLYFICCGKYIVTVSYNLVASLPPGIVISNISDNPITTTNCITISPIGVLSFSFTGSSIVNNNGNNQSYSYIVNNTCSSTSTCYPSSIYLGDLINFSFTVSSSIPPNPPITWTSSWTISVTYLGPN